MLYYHSDTLVQIGDFLFWLAGFIDSLSLYILTFLLKGTVSVISSDPPCKDNTARFRTVALKL